jgi:hypothetical protein
MVYGGQTLVWQDPAVGDENASAPCALEAEGISKSYVSSILRLSLPAPDLVEAILAGRTDQGMMLEQLERPLPRAGKGSATTSAGEPARGVGPPPVLVPCLAATPHHRWYARLGCPLPRLSACWPEGCGYPRKWGVSGVAKSLVNIDLLFAARRFYTGPQSTFPA